MLKSEIISNRDGAKDQINNIFGLLNLQVIDVDAD